MLFRTNRKNLFWLAWLVFLSACGGITSTLVAADQPIAATPQATTVPVAGATAGPNVPLVQNGFLMRAADSPNTCLQARDSTLSAGSTLSLGPCIGGPTQSFASRDSHKFVLGDSMCVSSSGVLGDPIFLQNCQMGNVTMHWVSGSGRPFYGLSYTNGSYTYLGLGRNPVNPNTNPLVLVTAPGGQPANALNFIIDALPGSLGFPIYPDASIDQCLTANGNALTIETCNPNDARQAWKMPPQRLANGNLCIDILAPFTGAVDLKPCNDNTFYTSVFFYGAGLWTTRVRPSENGNTLPPSGWLHYLPAQGTIVQEPNGFTAGLGWSVGRTATP